VLSLYEETTSHDVELTEMVRRRRQTLAGFDRLKTSCMMEQLEFQTTGVDVLYDVVVVEMSCGSRGTSLKISQ
jgi:hypothetical protein